MADATKFKNEFTVDVPMGSLCVFEGFEAPTFNPETGKMNGKVRVNKVDTESHTIWLESVPNG